jgi:hypothetical protein
LLPAWVRFQIASCWARARTADGLGEFAVVRQWPVGGPVRAEDIRQDHGVEVVGLFAGDRMAIAVAGGGHRIDGIDGAFGGAQAGNERPAGRLDGHGDRGVLGVAVVCQEVQ